ncbi:MAG: MFS transporter [Bacteroidota bacterium]
MPIAQKVLQGYKRVETHIWYAIAATFCIQIVNAAFFLLLNYYMVAEGYADFEVAEVLSYRFLSVALFAFPLGLYIKGRRLKPFFYLCAISFPIFSHLVIYAVEQHSTTFLYAMAMCWGLSFTCIEITILPYIILNAKKETHSEAISLKFLTFGMSLTSVGLLNYFLHWLDPTFFTERRVLLILATLSTFCLYFVYRIRFVEQLSYTIPFKRVYQDYDWAIVFRALLPTFIIAIGAGFTIPVINLFFLNVHGMPSDHFSILGSATFALVIIVMSLIPFIRRHLGYRTAITGLQSAAVVALLLLATTEYYSHWAYAIYVAAFFFAIRQPLMNAAGPMVSELVMYYVGKRNQEIMSALTASIWSGSWFFSTKMFAFFRMMELSYVNIFLITVFLYAIGVVWYYFLVKDYEKRTGDTGKIS